jgi:2-polyprenyl-3-methyl-5-hydroxy-6-metoxy-1,4-benzoquinol methylase
MDQRFAAGEAYGRVTLWDEVRNAELTATFRDALLRGRDPAATSILDIGCGLGGLAEQVKACRAFVGVDISEVAVHDAIRRYGHRPNYRFLRMDATKLDFPDGHFDVVAAREMVEHVPEPERCLAEAFRVLKPGGALVLSSPNRDSFHLRVNRLLGHKDFLCSYDHVREFAYEEMRAMVERIGFRIRDAAGVFLMPYWGIPGVDERVRPLTDGHPVMLDALREMGRRVGAEYAFVYVIAAEKPGAAG